MTGETIIGKLFGVDLIIKTADTKIVEKAKSKLSGNEYIYFTDYPDGHHPNFYKHHPELLHLTQK